MLRSAKTLPVVSDGRVAWPGRMNNPPPSPLPHEAGLTPEPSLPFLLPFSGVSPSPPYQQKMRPLRLHNPPFSSQFPAHPNAAPSPCLFLCSPPSYSGHQKNQKNPPKSKTTGGGGREVASTGDPSFRAHRGVQGASKQLLAALLVR